MQAIFRGELKPFKVTESKVVATLIGPAEITRTNNLICDLPDANVGPMEFPEGTEVSVVIDDKGGRMAFTDYGELKVSVTVRKEDKHNERKVKLSVAVSCGSYNTQAELAGQMIGRIGNIYDVEMEWPD